MRRMVYTMNELAKIMRKMDKDKSKRSKRCKGESEYECGQSHSDDGTRYEMWDMMSMSRRGVVWSESRKNQMAMEVFDVESADSRAKNANGGYAVGSQSMCTRYAAAHEQTDGYQSRRKEARSKGYNEQVKRLVRGRVRRPQEKAVWAKRMLKE
ncbi:hypothetical protein K438DRAFT_1786490 [Mycena galopus ATCC 62051]|nr:hypothetical protein K438DRAFT_1786490 [Mycena galopus ATCC 62051]